MGLQQNAISFFPQPLFYFQKAVFVHILQDWFIDRKLHCGYNKRRTK